MAFAQKNYLKVWGDVGKCMAVGYATSMCYSEVFEFVGLIME